MGKNYLLKVYCMSLLSIVMTVLSVENTFAQGEDINVRVGVTNYLSSSTFNFNSSLVGTPLPPKTFSIENLGSPTSLTLTGGAGNYITISGTNAADFAINQAGTTSPIPPTDSSLFTITFTPSATGVRTATIIINNSDVVGGENPYVINLTGTGLTPSNTITTGIITPTTFCAGTGLNVPFSLTGTYIFGNIFTVQLSDALGSFAAPTTIGSISSTNSFLPIPATIPPGQPFGTGYRIRVVASNPVVTGTNNGTNISIYAPQVANAGTDFSTLTNSPILNATAPTSGTGTWSVFAGAGSVVTLNAPNSSTLGLSLGQNRFIWTINNGPCPVTRDTISVTVAASVNGCEALTPNFAVDLSGNPTGFWDSPSIVRDGLCCSYGGANNCINFAVTLEPTANGIILDVISGALPPAPLFYESDCGVPSIIGSPLCFTGPPVHYVTFCKAGNNTNVYRVTSMKVDAAGPITGPNTVCTNELGVVYTIAPVLGATGYTWSVPIGATIVAGANTNSITVNFGSGGGNVSVTPFNACGNGTSSIMTLGIVCPTITTSAITPSSVCQGGPLNVPFTTLGYYYPGNVFTAELSDASGSFATPTAIGTLTATAGGTIAATIPVAQTIGAAYRIRVVSSTNVVVGTDNGTNISIDGPLSASLGPDDATCQGFPYLLSGTILGAPSNYLWDFGDATATATTATTNHAYAGPGNYTVTLTISKPGCNNAVDTKLMTVNSLPPNPIVSTPVTYCQGFAATALTATGAALLWYNVPTGGTGSGIAPTPSTVGIGTTLHYVSQTVLGCESPRAQIDVVVGPTLTASIVSAPASVCSGSTIPLVGNATGSPTNVFWTGGSAGTYSPNATTFSPTYTPSAADIAAGIVNFTFNAMKAGCMNSTVNVSVNITALPPSPAVITPVTYCQGFAATALTATGTALLWYNVPTGGTGSGIAPVPNTSAIGTIPYYVSQTISGCEGPRAIINVVVSPPLTASAGPNISGCVGASLPFAGGATGGPTSIQWNFGDATTASVLSTSHIYGVAGTYVGTLTVSKPGCTDATSTNTVTVTTVPAMPSPIVGTDTVCKNISGYAYNVINVPPNTYNWSYSGTGHTINGTTNAVMIDFALVSTSGTLSVTATNICGTSAAQILAIVALDKPATPSVISAITPVCENTSGHAFSVASDVAASFYNWTYSGTGHTITGGTTNASSFAFATGATSGTASVTAHNTCGASSARTLPITVLPFPAAPSAITGSTDICENSVGNPYDVTNVAGITYNWSYSGSGHTINGGTANAITMDMSFIATSGTLSVTATNACGTSGSATIFLTMKNIAAQPSVISGISTVCENSTNPYTVTLDATALSYNWSYNGSGHTINPTMNSASVDFATGATSGDLSVTATNACGVSMPRILPIIVSVPNVVINNPAPVCAPTTVDITLPAITTGSTAGLTYTQWQDPGASMPQPGAAGINTSGTYYIKGVDAFSCYDITPVTVVINAGILNSLSITPARDTICLGENTTVTINGTENGVTYTAYKNVITQVGTPILGDGSNLGIPITYAELNNFGNEITIQASLTGCTAVTLLAKDSIFKSDLLTAPTITSTVASLCSPGLAIFSVPNTFLKYKWYYGTSASFASASQWVNEALNLDTVDLPGFYFVEVSDNYNCKLNSAGKNIDYNIALPTVAQSGNTGKQVDLTCAVSSPYYQWYVENAGGKLRKIQGANGAVYRAFFDGIYYVAIQNSSCTIFSNGVGVSSMAGGSILKQNFFEDDSTVVVPEIAVAEVYAFPNPSNGTFDVQYLSSTEESTIVILYNSAGRPIAEKQVHQQGFISVSFEQENLDAGVYYIEVIQEGNVARKKILVY